MKKLVINNGRQDVTFVHEHVAYEIYRRAGQPQVISAHGLMTLNDKPYGLYVMEEAKDSAYLQKWYGSGTGNFYEVDVVDYVDGWMDPVNVDLKNDDDVPGQQDISKRTDLQALADATSAPDDQFLGAIKERLDLDQFINVYALDALLSHWDGPMFNTNNYYLYRNPADNRFVFVGHGIDQAFDLSFDPVQPPKLLLAQRIRAIPELDRQWRDSMNAIMESAWTADVLYPRIDKVIEIVGQAKLTSEAVGRDVATVQQFASGVRDLMDARKAEWLANPF
jgi:hypothetical protein